MLDYYCIGIQIRRFANTKKAVGQFWEKNILGPLPRHSQLIESRKKNISGIYISDVFFTKSQIAGRFIGIILPGDAGGVYTHVK